MLDRGRPVAYREIERESARVARGLREIGVRPGERVAIWLPNIPAWLALFFACARLGAIAVSLNTRFRSSEVADIVSRSRSRVLAFWPGFKNIDFAGILAGCDPQTLGSLEALIAYSEGSVPGTEGSVPGTEFLPEFLPYADLLKLAPLEDDASTLDAGCVIFTTSGTTKAPKFVLHDQKTVIRHARDVAAGFGYVREGTRILITAPLCGVFGFCNAMSAIAADRPMFMHPTFDAAEAAGAVRKHAITHTNCTDEMLAQMLAQAPGEVAFPSARFFGYAAFSPALADLPERAEARGLKVAGLYGSSELQALLARQHEDAPLSERRLAGGRLVAAGAQVRVRDPESGALLAHGSPGELEFSAPSRMAGYFEDDAASAGATSADGWFRSGDLGYTSADGRFVFIARLGDALRLSGFLVSPAEIEDVLQRHPHVAMAQVVGVETAAGVKPVAFVILKPGETLDEAQVLVHCAAQMAKHKVPLRIQALAEFPVTPGANATKIQKAKLREMAKLLLE